MPVTGEERTGNGSDPSLSQSVSDGTVTGQLDRRLGRGKRYPERSQATILEAGR